MHIEGQHPPKPGNGLTTRELADAINELIQVRITIHEMTRIYNSQCLAAAARGDFVKESMQNDFNKACGQALEQAEVITRKIADGFKSHSGAHGVYHE